MLRNHQEQERTIYNELNTFRQESWNYLNQLIAQALESVRLLGFSQQLENILEIFRTLNSPRQYSELQEHCTKFENAFIAFIKTITSFKKEKNEFQLEDWLNGYDTNQAMLDHYHEIHALKKTLTEALKNPQSLKNAVLDPVAAAPLPLANEAYADLALFIQLIRPESMNDLLHQYQGALQAKREQIQNIRARFGQGFSEAIRLQHIKNVFANQLLYNAVVLPLNIFVQRPENLTKNAQELLAELKRTKNETREQTLNREAQLESHYDSLHTILYTIVAELSSAILNYPEYKISRSFPQLFDSLSARAGTAPETYKYYLGHLTGLVALIATLKISTRIGYSYHFISTISRIPLAHIERLFQIGGWLDSAGKHIDHALLTRLENISPTQLSSFYAQLRELMRWDELGVIEKDSLLKWITGLLVHLPIDTLTGGQSLIPAMTGYVTAIGCRNAVGWLIRSVAQKLHIPLEISTFAQIGAQIGAYTSAYRYGYNFGGWLCSKSRPSDQKINEALRTLGFHSSATEKEIRHNYHELSLQFHPDKCPSPECEEKFIEVANAYELLMKKMQ